MLSGEDDPIDYEPLSIDPPPYSDPLPTSDLKQSAESNDPPPAILPSTQPPQYDPREYKADYVQKVLILQQVSVCLSVSVCQPICKVCVCAFMCAWIRTKVAEYKPLP